MSQSQPQDSDAVIGTNNRPERDAVVLGGIDGLERKIAHDLRSRTNPKNVDSAEWKLPEPIDSAIERERLQKLATALSVRQIECKFIEPSPDLLDRLSDRGRSDFDRDIRSVSTQRIVRNFPWDKTGRIELKTAVIFNVYDKVYRHWKDRDTCLAAIAPDRRSDEQIIRIELIDTYAIDRNHRWENCPWLWTDVETPISEWLGTNKHPKTTENELAMRSLTLLNEGKIEDALGRYGVVLSDTLHQLIGNVGIKYYPYYDFTNDEHIRWRSMLVDTLRQSAPWKLPQAIIFESKRLQYWASQKKSRRQRPPILKLALFPNQRHTHKTSLMLVGDLDGSNPRLIMDENALNDRLHFTAWKRSIEVDFDRYEIEFDR
jgi:hypothetical protein